MLNHRPSQCPYCKNTYIVKNGKNNTTQRYLCKSCKKSFVHTTNTTIYYSKKSKKLWQQYIEHLYNQLSLRTIASKLDISVTTAFYWRHKLLDCLRDQNSKDVLSNIIHCKEMTIKLSYKGNFSNSTINIPSSSSHSNEYPINLMNHKKISVLVASDNETQLVFAPTIDDNPSETSLIAALNNNIAPNSTLITYNIPNLSLYKDLFKYNIINLANIYSYKNLCTYFSLNKFIVADYDSYIEDSVLYKRNIFSENTSNNNQYINDTKNNSYTIINKSKDINSNVEKNVTTYDNKINFSKIERIIINYSFFIYPYKGISLRYLSNYLALFKSIYTNKFNSVCLLSFIGLKPFYPWNHYTHQKTA